MPDDLDLRVEQDAGGSRRIVVSGEVDIANVQAFRTALAAAMPGAAAGMVVDVTELRYIDSAGLAVLFEHATKQPIEIVVGPGCLVATVIEIVRLADVATVRRL